MSDNKNVEHYAAISAWIKSDGLTPVARILKVHPPHFGKMLKTGIYSDEALAEYKKHFKIKDEISKEPMSTEEIKEKFDVLMPEANADAAKIIGSSNPVAEEQEIMDDRPSPKPDFSIMEDLNPQQASLTGKRLAILVPFYRQTNPVTNFALMALMDKTKMSYFQRHNTIIDKARNMLADDFLKSGCEWSFWLDDDMIPPIGNEEWFYEKTKKDRNKFPRQAAGHNAILRLHSHGKKIVSALYFGRNSEGRAMFAEALRNDEAGARADAEARRDAGRNHLKQTAWAATGCVLVHRDVYLAVKEKFPELQPANKNLPFQFFTPDPTDAGGEDRAFFQRARAAGHISYLDMGCVCGHVGLNVWTDENTSWKKTK